MNENIGNLNVRISADISALQDGLKSATSGMNNFRKNVTPVVKSMAAMTTAVAGAAAGVVYFTKSVSDNAREITAMASVANATAQELQRMSYATRTVGIDQAKLADILKDVNDRTGDFLQTGAGEMVDFFENIAPKVGLTAEAMAKMSGPQALQAMVSALEASNLSMAETTFYMEALANDSTRLIPLLRNGGEELNRMAAEADALGIVLSDIELASLKDFGNEFNRMAGIIRGVSNLVAVELAPVLAEVGDRITSAAVEMGGMDVAIRTTVENGIRLISGFADRVHEFRIQIAGIDRAWYEAQYAVANFVESSWRMLSPFFDNIVNQVNTVVAAFELIPGVGDLGRMESFSGGDFFQGIMDQTDRARESVQAARTEFVRLSEQDMPSSKIDEFFDAVDARREALKEQIANDGGLIPGMGGGGGLSEEEQKALDKMREQLEQRVEMLRESLLTEREVELERYAEANEDLRAALDLELITQQEYDQLKEDNHKHHTDRITQMDEEAAKRRVELARQVADQEKRMRQDVANLAIGLLSTLGSENKAFALASIALTKGMAIAQTIAHTQTASMLAYASQLIPGDPSSVARAATAALATQKMGAIKVGLIAATGLAQAGSVIAGSGGSGGGGYGTSGGSNGAGSGPGNQPAPQEASPVGGTLTVQGISSNALFTGDSVRALAEELISYQKRGGTIVID